MQEALRKKEFELAVVDTLLNWGDIGTKAHAAERLEVQRLRWHGLSSVSASCSPLPRFEERVGPKLVGGENEHDHHVMDFGMNMERH